jgi:hypothetical protein
MLRRGLLSFEELDRAEDEEREQVAVPDPEEAAVPVEEGRAA